MAEPTVNPDPGEEETALQDAQQVMLDKHCAILMEHFDSVRIFVTRQRHDDPETCCAISRGKGNWFTQYGMIRDWIITKEAETTRDVYNRSDDE